MGWRGCRWSGAYLDVRQLEGVVEGLEEEGRGARQVHVSNDFSSNIDILSSL